jgi:protein tyrosine phosphatase
VVLAGNESGDYINANHMTLSTPDGTTTNRYIATQGPTKKTMVDFWTMVQQEKCSLIVMLTNLSENGRVKCHQYWPDTSNSNWLKLGNGIQLQCLREQFDETDSFAFREFMLRNTATGEERIIQHMHYLVWPDHGVPDDVQQCLDFLQNVRRVRDEVSRDAPVVVHCSAGVGRTGVLIMLDMAVEYLNSNSPIDTLGLVAEMRNQRSKMIQTMVSGTRVSGIRVLTFYRQFFLQTGTISFCM